MSVVKSVALGASLMGWLVAPTLAQAGSIRGNHHTSERSPRAVLPDSPAPTSLKLASAPVAPAATPAPVAAAVAPLPRYSQENLANIGLPVSGPTYTSYNMAAPSAAPLTLGITNSGAVTAPVAYTPITAPTPTPAAASMVAPLATTSSVASGASSAHTVDALINFGQAPYSEAQSLTTGTPQSWTLSPSVQAVFHGTPNAAQQATFMSEVLAVAQNTYNIAGLPVSLTLDPSQNYAHTMSVVSGASYTGNPSAIGITDVGNDGFSFIDKFNLAKTPEELAMAIGHNVAHELMHAFGIASHPDQSGAYLDAASANWSTLTNAQTSFSPAATQMLAAQNFLNGPGKEFTQGALGISGLELLTEHHVKTCNCPLCQALHKMEAAEGLTFTTGDGAAPVPEPTTVALWTIGGIGGLVVRRRRGLV